MGCCGSKDGGSSSKVSLGDCPDKPEVDGMGSVNDCCSALWGVKDKWSGIRQPMGDAVDGLGEAADWKGGDVPGIARGLIACVC